MKIQGVRVIKMCMRYQNLNRLTFDRFPRAGTPVLVLSAYPYALGMNWLVFILISVHSSVKCYIVEWRHTQDMAGHESERSRTQAWHKDRSNKDCHSFISFAQQAARFCCGTSVWSLTIHRRCCVVALPQHDVHDNGGTYEVPLTVTVKSKRFTSDSWVWYTTGRSFCVSHFATRLYSFNYNLIY